MVTLDAMATFDAEVKAFVDVLYPAVVHGCNERAGVESEMSTIRMKKQEGRVLCKVKTSKSCQSLQREVL